MGWRPLEILNPTLASLRKTPQNDKSGVEKGRMQCPRPVPLNIDLSHEMVTKDGQIDFMFTQPLNLLLMGELRN